jgi:hypothetical protein
MTIQPFYGVDLAPGEYTVQESFENEFTGGRWENRDILGGAIASTVTDSGHTSYTNILRAGLLMGNTTSTNKLGVYAVAGTTGVEEVFGILKNSVQMNVGSVAAERFTGNIISGGIIDPTKIILSTETRAAIVGLATEFHIRKQLKAQGFKLTDALWEVPYGGVRKTVAKTADYTVTDADRNTRFTNAGAVGAVIFTLPATAKLGLEYWFNVVADQNVTVTAGTADTMIVFNDIAADSVAFSTASEKVGGALHVYGDGAKWVVEVMLGQLTQEVTVAT